MCCILSFNTGDNSQCNYSSQNPLQMLHPESILAPRWSLQQIVKDGANGPESSLPLTYNVPACCKPADLFPDLLSRLVVVVITCGVDVCLIHEELQHFVDLVLSDLRLQSLDDLHWIRSSKGYHTSLPGAPC